MDRKSFEGYGDYSTLVVDIEDSTGKVASCRNQSEVERLAMLFNDALFQTFKSIKTCNGTVARHEGDSLFGVFNNPADAIRAAFSCRKDSSNSEIGLKFGFGNGKLYGVSLDNGDFFLDGPAKESADMKTDTAWDIKTTVDRIFPHFAYYLDRLETDAYTMRFPADYAEHEFPVEMLSDGLSRNSEPLIDDMSFLIVESRALKKALALGEDVKGRVLEYYGSILEIAKHYGGRVDALGCNAKITFDGFEDNSLRAVSAARDLERECNICTGLAVSSGTVLSAPIVGRMTEIGETVIRGFRLADKGKVILDEKTYNELKPKVVCHEDEKDLKGLGKTNFFYFSDFGEDVQEVNEEVPFVGRKHELEELSLDCFTAVSGEPGVGKTRLIHEAIRNMETYKSACSVGDRLPFQSLVRVAKKMQPNIKAEIESIIEDVALEIPEKRRAIKSKLADIIANSDNLIVLEDIHYADIDSIDVLRDISPDSRIVVTYRPEFGIDLDCKTIELSPLSQSDAKQLVESLGEEWTNELYNKSQGNPLFLIAMLKHKQIDDDNLAERSKKLIHSRINGLGSYAHNAMELSVLGDEFDTAFADKLLDIDLEALQERGVIEKVNGNYMFKGLFRENLYDMIIPSRKKELHRKALEIVEGEKGVVILEGESIRSLDEFISESRRRLDTKTCYELAQHSLGCNDIFRGYVYSLIAGDKVRLLGNADAAVSLYEDMLNVVLDTQEWHNWADGKFDDGSWEMWRFATGLRSRMSEAYASSRNIDGMFRVCKDVEAANKDIGTLSRDMFSSDEQYQEYSTRMAYTKWDLLNKFGICHFAWNNLNEAENYYTRAGEVASENGFIGSQLTSICNMAIISRIRGEEGHSEGYIHALELLEDAELLLDSIPEDRRPIYQIEVFDEKAMIYCDMAGDSYADAFRYAHESNNLIEDSGDSIPKRKQIGSQATLTRVYSMGNAFDKAEEHGQKALELAEHLGDDYDKARCHYEMGCFKLRAGSIDEAKYHFRTGLEFANRAGNIYSIAKKIKRELVDLN